MSPQPIVCIDRLLAPKLRAERMALVKANCWTPGSEIRIGFLSGSTKLRNRVQQAAEGWLPYATKLNFLFGATVGADIRIAFVPDGSWSTIGTQCQQVASDQPTMNFGWLTDDSPQDEVDRVVLHEFGHALGCIHEHQNPAGGIHWNKEAVYKYYMGPPNNWTKEQVDHNLFEVYDATLTSYTQLDGQSIMMYPIDPAFTTDGYSVGLNKQLSATDKAFIAETYS